MSELLLFTISKSDRKLHDRRCLTLNFQSQLLDPFIENENFRQAVKDCGEKEFKTHDKKIRNDVIYLMNNLCDKYRYTQQGAREVCIYVIDNDLTKKFSKS